MKRWIPTEDAISYSSPAIGADGTVYLGTPAGMVYALDGQTRQVKWAVQTGSPVASSPVIGTDGTIYVGSTNGKVYALDGQTGDSKGVFQTGGNITSSPTIGADGMIYVGSNDGKVYALRHYFGSRWIQGRWTWLWIVDKRWAFPTGSWVLSSPAIGADGTVYVRSDDGKVFALDGKTGKRRWSCNTGLFVSSSPAIGTDDIGYVGSEDWGVHAIK